MATKKKRKSARDTGAAAPLADVPSAAIPPAPAAAAALRPILIDAALLRRLALWAAALACAWSIRSVWVPLLFVGVVAFLGDPLVRRLEQRRVPRALGAGMVIVGGVLALVAMLALVVPSLVSDLLALAGKLPELLTSGAALVEQRFGVSLPTQLTGLSSEAGRELFETLKPFATGSTVATTVTTGVGILQGAAGALGTLAQAALVPVLGYFLLAELPASLRLALSFVPPEARPFVSYYRPRAADALSRLVRGQVVVASIMAVLYLVGLSIARVPLALAVAILAGAAYLIPFASAAVCFVLAASLSLLELGAGAGGPVLGTLVTCVVVQLVEGYVLTPRIVGEQAGLSPLAALLAVLCGGAAGGFLGVLFALPIASVLALILREEARRRDSAAVWESA